MKSIPKSGKKEIIGHTVNILYVDNLRDEKGVKLCGECDPDHNIIRIERKQNRRQKQTAIVHEQIHFIDNKLELGLTHKQVTSLESALISIKAVKE